MIWSSNSIHNATGLLRLCKLMKIQYLKDVWQKQRRRERYQAEKSTRSKTDRGMSSGTARE